MKATAQTTRAVEEQPIAYIAITKVVREERPILPGPNEVSLGEMVDRTLAEIARNGEEVQEFTLRFEPEQWEEFKSALLI